MTPLPAGASIGILGGGQLGRMLAMAAARLGFDVHVFCPDEGTPAARVASTHWHADYSDRSALLAFAKSCDVVTLEFENVPAKAAEAILSTGVPFYPGKEPLAVSQDRLAEKRYLNDCGIPTTEFRPIHARAQLADALDALGGKAILKTRRDGYDGKGQAWLHAAKDIPRAWDSIGHVPAILEAVVDYDCEISVLVARGRDGTCKTWAPPLNTHSDGILIRSAVPSGVSEKIEKDARKKAVALAEKLDYVGVLALEFFVLESGKVLANEFAPRVHNSGHWTPEACQTGQFEQHIRAIAGWSLGETRRLFDAEMENLIGEAGLVDGSNIGPSDVLTLYGKKDAREGRKMGHITRRLAART